MILHVITACTRPQNLVALYDSLGAWGPEADVHWHLRFDINREHIGGQQVKNEMLDKIPDGWVLVLDDDTIVHPDLWERLQPHQDREAIVVSQRHSVLGILHASPKNVAVGKIDIGQAIIRREAIGAYRIPRNYAGDGEFLSTILPKLDAVYLDEVLSFHNALG